MKKLLTSIAILAACAIVFAAAPVVSNVVATPSAGKVTITYNLSADGVCDVTMLVSADNGGKYNDVPPAAVSGAVGSNVSPGTGKRIIWHPGLDGLVPGNNYKVKVIARNNPTAAANDDFVYVAGGTFHNGTSYVTLSSFYIDKHEVTQAEYQAVMGTSPSNFNGFPNRPVEQVSWFDAIEYCNRRSIQELLTPCYSYGSYGTNPDNWPSGWNTSDENNANVSCNWSANGYRLPTEMEWMFAAMGGNQSQGYTYSGSNSLDAVAWCSSNSNWSTHNVGQRAPNELGIFDMSGNVLEWVWDIYHYLYPSGNQTNPRGPSTGLSHVLRGGSYVNGEGQCTVAYRQNSVATWAYITLGFRVVRFSP